MKNLMKITGLLLIVLTVLSSFKLNSKLNEAITWESKTIDMGEIEIGNTISKQFTFVNNHDVAIKILKTKAACGCTVTEHTTEEIAVGEKGHVSVKYTAKQAGPFNKTVQVFTSAGEEAVVLTLKGKVK